MWNEIALRVFLITSVLIKVAMSTLVFWNREGLLNLMTMHILLPGHKQIRERVIFIKFLNKSRIRPY